MTASDKKKTGVLALLIVGAGLSWFYVYRPTTGSPSNVTAAAPAKAKAPKIGQEAQIRVDLVPNTESVSVGQKNLFQYRQAPAVTRPPDLTQRPVVTQQVQPITPVVTPTSQPAFQPWKPFRYEGFSVSKGGGKILGSITESGTTYEVKEGDCMMGQYCVTRLTENLVEIEDLQLKRKQTFTRVQVQ